MIHTLCPISLSGLSSVRYKTTQNTGSVGRAGAATPTYKLRKFLSWPLALSMSTYSNFQINGASRETLKPPDPRLLKQNRGLEVSTFLPKLHLFGNCYKSTYLEPRTMTKTSQIYKQEGQPQPIPHCLYLGQFYSVQLKDRKHLLDKVYVAYVYGYMLPKNASARFLVQ